MCTLSWAAIVFMPCESHAPFPCPTAKTIYILLKFHSVLCTFDFAITNTVISKQPYLWVNICCDIVNIQWEQHLSKDGALGDTWQNRSPIWFYSIYYNSLLSETEKRILKVQDKRVNLSAVIQDFSPIVYNSDQLSFTAVPLSECMLSIRQKLMFVKMCHDIRAYCVFKQLARYTSWGDRTVIASQRPISFFKEWTYSAVGLFSTPKDLSWI